MSISRAFTTRRMAKNSEPVADMPKRSLTTKHSFSSGTIRNKISAPIELISTTNMLSYNAPDIYPRTASSSSSTSGEDSDLSSPANGDSSSIESTSPTSPKPNHLSCYFGTSSTQSGSGDEAPSIPKRAPSHTKKHSQNLAHQRSISGMSTSASVSRKTSTSTARSSINMFSANPDTIDHRPFSKELAQVDEMVEEYTHVEEQPVVSSAPKEPLSDEEYLKTRGLAYFRVEDYMSEIHDFINAFCDSSTRPSMSSTMWI